MDKIINIQNIDPVTLELQTYSNEDQNLISSFDIENTFTSSANYIEYTIYDLNQNLLYYTDLFSNYSILNNQVNLTPEKDLELYGFEEGQYITNYSFFKNILGSSNDNTYYISEISSDRTEIRLDTVIIDNNVVVSESINFTNELQQSNYYKDFYLNFGDNKLAIANNILLDNSDINNPTVLIKLYEPLPIDFDLKSELWVVESIAEPLAYQIDITLIFDNLDNNVQLQGPNFNISIKDKINNSTEFTNLNSLTSTLSPYGSSSLKYQLNSVLAEKGIELNIDYTDYSNFVFFSSAQTRIENFYYKVSLIEDYSEKVKLSTSGASSGSYYVSASFDIYQAKINDIITNFDGYEYYLYYDSGSKAWPKTNSTPPYINASTGSVAVQNWLILQYASASAYDNNLNPNNLINTIPSYLRDDSTNDQYILFIEMIGQHFDYIWTYIKDINNKYNADNRLDHGVSKDLVADILRDLGIKIYQNNFSTNDLYTAFLGISPNGTLVAPTGSEVITNYISASNYIALDDVNKSIYKRIYHNLPYLLKKKGTVEGLRTLITLYGIPDTILRINEFGGKDKDNSNDWDQWQDEYNLAFVTNGTNFLSSSFSLNSSWNAFNNVPNAVEFRFKPENTPPTNLSQSIWSTDKNVILTLTYTGSGLTSASYSGSTLDPYYQYGTLTLYPVSSNNTSTASIYLPFFNGDWWSVLINSGSNGYELISKNKLYTGNDGNQIGFQASSSVSVTANWSGSTISYFGTGSLNSSYKIFSGSFQEIRYYTIPLSQSTFDDFVVNPSSIESSNNLAFRAPLGNELYINSSSNHPKITGSWVSTASFTSNSNFVFKTSPTYSANTEYFFLDQPPIGIQNVVNNKIKIADLVVPTGNTLSSYISIQQNLPISGNYTRDLNLLEVALSPQDQINRDIMSQYGYFNIGDYIGDPRQFNSTNTSYPDLNTLRDLYFQKYTHNYNLNDYIRLIKYFDNSLFKMIKDFVPARTSLASGIVIKPHLLERNRYRVPSASFSQLTYSSSVKSFPFDFVSSSLYKSSGGQGGSIIVPISQSWNESIVTPLGIVSRIHDDQSELLTGEFSGSELTVTTQSLLPQNNSFTLEQVGSDSGGDVSIAYRDINYEFYSDQVYYLSFTITNSGGLPDSVQLYIRSLGGIVLYTSPSLNPSTTLTVEGILIKNTPSALLSLVHTNAINPAVTVTNIIIYQAPKSLFNPILNNVSSYPNSQYFEDIDYSSGQLIPANQTLLINGTATPANVKDYYYYLRRQTYPRYVGSKLTGAQINKYTDGDITYGKQPVINNYQTYFATFIEIRSAYPELVGKSTIFIKELIDENGNRYQADESGSTFYYNLKDNFVKDSQVNIQLTNIDNNGSKNPAFTSLNGDAIVFRPVTLWPKVILTNETGSRWTSGSVALYSTGSIAVRSFGTSPTSSTFLNPSFSVGVNSRNIMTSSISSIAGYIFSSSILNILFIQDNTISASGGFGGYDPITLPLIIKPGQEIRFLQNEDFTYTIISASYESNTRMYFHLNTNITSSITSSLNNGYLIREYTEDSSKIVINKPKQEGYTGPGYIIPQYMSPTLTTNFDKIVSTLKENGTL
jgi:hypothetical protein